MRTSAPDYSGWGAKKGSKVRTWKNRYFVLRGRELVYYSGAKSDDSGAGLGEKGRLKVLNVDYTPNLKNGLLIHGEGKDLKMTTANAHECRLLYRKIKTAIGEQEASFKPSTLPTHDQLTKKAVDREGWLFWKDRQSQAWEDRYITLSGNQLELRTDLNAAPIDSLALIRVEKDDTNPLSLRLVADNHKVAYVTAETREEIKRWDGFLAAAIGQPAILQKKIKKQESVVDTELIAQKYTTVECEGWLEILTKKNKIWKKRYLSLVNGMLETRKGPMEQSSAVLLVIDVRYSHVYLDALEIQVTRVSAHSDEDNIYVRAETARDLEQWTNALCDAIGKPRVKPTDLDSEPSSPLSNRSFEDRQSKPQLLPIPTNMLSQDNRESLSCSSASPTVKANCSSDKQVGMFASGHHRKRGWLYERDDVKSSWKLRSFVLKGSTLFYNNHDNGVTEKLGTILNVGFSEDSSGHLCVNFIDGGSLSVNGETKADTDAWYIALCEASRSSVEKRPRTLKSNQDDNRVDQSHDGGFRGYLLKKGQYFKTWKRRYFVLESSRLVYSASSGSEVLGSGIVFDVDVGDIRPFCLNIRFQNGRLLHVVAPTEEAFSRWLYELQKASDLVESVLAQSDGNVLFDEEFDADVNENENDATLDFTPEDLAEYDVTLRDGEGTSLWYAAMQSKPEHDAQSSFISDRSGSGLDLTDHDSANDARCMRKMSSISANESQRCTGWLKKEGKNVKNWKKRYFTLHGSKLSYYRSETGTLLRSVTVANVSAHPSISLGLIVSTASNRKLIIQGESKDEFNKWLGAIQAAVEEGRKKQSIDVETPTMHMIMDRRSSDDLKPFNGHSGWLQKEGRRFKTWKKRYFTLKNKALIYYREIGGVVRGHGLVWDVYEDDTKPFTLVIKFQSGKTMRVTAANEVEMNAWYQALSHGRASSGARTAVSDSSDDVVDLDVEKDSQEREARTSRFDAQDYIDDTISNDTFMRLCENDGKGTMLNSRAGRLTAFRSFQGELMFNDEDEMEDFGLGTNGTDFYRKLLAEDAQFQHKRLKEKGAKNEALIPQCAPCCAIM